MSYRFEAGRIYRMDADAFPAGAGTAPTAGRRCA